MMNVRSELRSAPAIDFSRSNSASRARLAGVKLPLERQLSALESTEAYQRLAATPEFAAYAAAFEGRRGGLASAFEVLDATDAFTAFRYTRQARAIRDTLARCRAEGCTPAQQRLLDTSVTLSLID